MAACGSFQHIFETSSTSLPEAHHKSSSSLIDSLSSSSWTKNQHQQIIKPDHHSFTELFGELHFKENSPQFSNKTTSSSSLVNSKYPITSSTKSNDGFCPTKYDNSNSSLQLCTEGLGFESLVDDVKEDDSITNCCTTNSNISTTIDSASSSSPTSSSMEKKPVNSTGSSGSSSQYRISRNSGRTFPPPISCISRTGKPWVSFRSYRHDGRFVLQEVRIPSQEFLHASRQDGRLKLRFVHPDDDDAEETDNDFEEEEECESVEVKEKNEEEKESVDIKDGLLV